MQQLAENLWLMRFPLRLVGTEIGRTVSIIRLRSGDLVIHSTAPFATDDVKGIAKLGTPKWLLDVTLFHDTCAKGARAMFPSAAYLAPEGFPYASQRLIPPPPEWDGELEILELAGMPAVREHVMFHKPSRTLIVADIVFNFGPNASPWTRFFFRFAAGVRTFPGMSRMFRFSIRDPDAFRASVRKMFEWDFDRLIVAHGEMIASDAKAKLGAALNVI